jgi:prepilin-type N-terminal cleavage/methylation domain-containing protein/prepilin-type processing-associated H-X9-DG protein
MRRPSHNAGFTLIELLLVIAIIGTLVALLLPAIQAARESSRRASCVNNLMQIGLAISNDEATHKSFPPGAVWGRWDPPKEVRFRGSLLIYILPYLEQATLYYAFDFKQLKLDGATFPDTSTPIGSTVIDTYICPSDNFYNGTFGERGIFNYAASNGPTGLYDNPECSCPNPYPISLQTAPIDDLTDYAGPFTRLGIRTKASQITDGLSKTIFVGEVRVGCSEHVQAGWAWTKNGNGYYSTLIPINYDTCDDNASDPCRRPKNWNTAVGFKSAHPGGANFSFGDGSVHFLTESIDMQSYQYLGDKADGVSVSPE